MKIVSIKVLFLVLGFALLGGDAWARDTGYQEVEDGVTVLPPTPKKKPSFELVPSCPRDMELIDGRCQRPARLACKPGQKVASNLCICKQPLTVVNGVCVSMPVWIHEP